MQLSKKTMIVMAAALFAATPLMAGEYGNDVGNKFTRGLANTATGWGEIPKNIANESSHSNVLVGITWGTVKGAAHAIGRTGVGVFDLGTFFVPSDEYVHSTYVWQDSGKETSYGSY